MSHYAVILVVRSDQEPNEEAVAGLVRPSADVRYVSKPWQVASTMIGVDQTYAQRPGALWRESYAATRRELEYST